MNPYLLIFNTAITLCLLILLLTAFSNIAFFPKLQHAPNPKSIPSISILIPARNEAAVIGHTVAAILAQTITNFELILLDDGSTDGTAAQATAAADGDLRLRIVQGRPLPADWLGKNWSCHQLSQAANGDLLIFVDADVQWQPDALAALLAAQDRADLLTIWPTQQTLTWTERLVVPVMKFVIFTYLPIIGVHFLPFAAFAAANGQCLLFQRQAYKAIGGHAAVRNSIVEDVALARRIKQNGRRLRMTDGNGLIACRMYHGWPAVRDGFAKNILAGHANSLLFLLFSTLFHWSLFVWPWLWLLLGGGGWALALSLLTIVLRLTAALFTNEPLGYAILEALLTPISVLLFTLIAAQAVKWHFGRGPRWKGRVARSRHQVRK